MRTEVGEGAHLGLLATECIRIAQEGAKPSEFEHRSPEWMREYLESAPDHVDRRIGYATELEARRRSLGGPQDELARAVRYIIRQMDNMWPETPLGAAQEAGVPSVLHEGIGRSATYELVARCAGKKLLAFFERHPEGLDHPPMTFQPGQDVADSLDTFIKATEPEVWEYCAGRDGLHWTGFQCGWAVNAARFILGRGPVQNPAILHVVDDDTDQEAELAAVMPFSVDTNIGGEDMVVIFESNKRPND